MFELSGCIKMTQNEIYGTYNTNEISPNSYSRFKIHPDNTYCFESGACMGSYRDTGTMIVHEDTLLFNSLTQTENKNTKNLMNSNIKRINDIKFIVRNDSIIYYYIRITGHNTKVYPEFSSNCAVRHDTLIWIKTKIKSQKHTRNRVK